MGANDIANLVISGATGLGMISVVLYLGAMAIIKPRAKVSR